MVRSRVKPGLLSAEAVVALLSAPGRVDAAVGLVVMPVRLVVPFRFGRPGLEEARFIVDLLLDLAKAALVFSGAMRNFLASNPSSKSIDSGLARLETDPGGANLLGLFIEVPEFIVLLAVKYLRNSLSVGFRRGENLALDASSTHLLLLVK